MRPTRHPYLLIVHVDKLAWRYMYTEVNYYQHFPHIALFWGSGAHSHSQFLNASCFSARNIEKLGMGVGGGGGGGG